LGSAQARRGVVQAPARGALAANQGAWAVRLEASGGAVARIYSHQSGSGVAMRGLRRGICVLSGAVALAMGPAFAADLQQARVDAQAAETTAAAIAPTRLAEPPREQRVPVNGGDDIEQLIDLISNPATASFLKPPEPPPPPPVAKTPAQPPVPKIDLWERIRRGFVLQDLTNKFAVTATRWYSTQPDYIARMSSRASLYLYHIVEEIEKRGMPMELA